LKYVTRFLYLFYILVSSSVVADVELNYDYLVIMIQLFGVFVTQCTAIRRLRWNVIHPVIDVNATASDSEASRVLPVRSLFSSSLSALHNSLFLLQFADSFNKHDTMKLLRLYFLCRKYKCEHNAVNS